jgi:protein FrlC
MKLSFNTWPYSSFPVWLPAYPLEEAIRRLARIGYDAVEIGAASPHAYPPTLSAERRARIRDVLQENKIVVSSMLPALSGGPGHNVASPIAEERRHTIDHYKDLAELCQDWGATTLLYIPGWVVFGTTRREAWGWSVAALREIAEDAGARGVTLVIEPTSFDSNLVDTADHAVEMMEEVGLSNVKLMFDTFHVLYRREVITDYVYRMGADLAHMHLSEERRLAPGQGRADFPALIDALEDVGFDGYLTMEIGFDRRDIEPDKVARDAFEYTKGLLESRSAEGRTGVA